MDKAFLCMYPWLSAVTNLTRSDVIGDGGLVYHIWQGGDTARMGIGREWPSFTKSRPSRALQTMRSLTGVVVKTNPSCDYWSEDLPSLRLFHRHICEIIQSEITVLQLFSPSCV